MIFKFLKTWGPKKKEILSLIEDKKELNKKTLSQIITSLNLELDSNEQDFIILTLFRKCQSFQEIPIKAFKEFLEPIFEIDKYPETKDNFKENNTFFSEKQNFNNEEIEKTQEALDFKISRPEEDYLSKKTKNSKLPPIESPKNQPKPESKITLAQKQDNINKKIMVTYGKFDVIEEEKVGDSVESYNDYLVKIKPKNEESFSIVEVLVKFK